MGKQPFYANLEEETLANGQYRNVVYTVDGMFQLVYMSLKPQETIPMEVHPHTTQFFRVESGFGSIQIGGTLYALADGVGVVVPPNTRHEVVNLSKKDHLKLYTIYVPPEH